LRDKIQSILADNRRGEIMRAGIRLAIFGPPNVGKSSLLNFLGTMALLSHRIYADEKRWAAQRDAAIVTHVPGTTRDILELSLDIGGLPVLVADTAGLRDTTDEVEKIGIERARKAYVLSLNPFLLILLSVSAPSNFMRFTGLKLQMFRFSFSRVQTQSRPHQHRRVHGSRFLLS
jgi:tRNA U34 5-carboxymethylaminomethyl modifying GTPase MnmE/TrmE